MRGRSSSSKQVSKVEMEIEKSDNNNKLKEEPHLSGAYIRSLVKQLTSSRTKDNPPMNPKHLDGVDGDNHQNFTKFGETYCENQPNQQPVSHKKQIRRRLHASRPYQERLLNMAEARREIVTALKFHRAAMKQANEQQPPPPPPPSPPPPSLEQQGKAKSRRNPRRTYASTSTTTASNFSTYLDHLSYFSCPSQISPPLPNLPVPENLTLPNQTLGLNLNLHDFNNLDASFYHNPSSSTSSPPTLSVTTEEIPYMTAISQQLERFPLVAADASDSGFGVGFHPAMDDEEIAEIKSIGEQHEMEWNDTLNSVTSACWFKFLKTLEINHEEQEAETGNGYNPFDQVMEFPAWLNANENCLQQHLNDYCPDDYFQHPSLPCLDIEEIEEMDGEWLV